MKRISISLAVYILLTTSVSAEITGQQIVQALREHGVPIQNIIEEERNPDAPLPNSYDVRWSFQDTTLSNGKGGQFFICSRKSFCDAIFKYFEAFSFFAGPYLYRNPEGTVVFQLNSSHSPKSAEKYETVLSEL